jgi:sulfite exporter TauE/SafE
MVELPTALGSPGLVTFFVVGLLGGAHCLGMCGPLVTAYAERMGSDGETVRWADIRQHLLFNLGRTISYAAIGALMGLAGALVFDAAAIVRAATGVRATAGIVVGAFIVVVGVTYIARGSAGGAPHLPVAGTAFERLSGAMLAHIDTWTRGPRIAGLGMVHGLLPCPILYPAFLYALAQGSPIGGALALTALGLGTLPTLFVYGTVFQSIRTSRRIALHRALGVVFLVLGYLPLSHGLGLLGIGVPHLHLPIYQPL